MNNQCFDINRGKKETILYWLKIEKAISGKSLIKSKVVGEFKKENLELNDELKKEITHLFPEINFKES